MKGRHAQLAAAIVLALLAAGCAAPLQAASTTPGAPSALATLAAKDAQQAVTNADGSRTFVFEGKTPQHDAIAGVPIMRPASLVMNASFPVASAADVVELTLSYDSKNEFLVADLLDARDRVQCRIEVGPPDARCATPTGASGSDVQAWHVRVVFATTYGPGVPFQANVTLHPVGYATHGDPLAGVDRSIRFRTVDTKFGQSFSEPNIGVLADGTIFADHGSAVMRSKDDGKTWTDVEPPASALGDCDPNMRVDPWSSRVYVAYLQCPFTTTGSVLSWSSDEGATWVTNPYAGPEPLQDHQKLAMGPPLVPGSGVPIVYYGATVPQYPEGTTPTFVSRSLDGGFTFTTTAVSGVNDGIHSRTIGSIEADRAGNVYAPVPICGKDYFHNGTIDVGVSNDQGASFKLVEVTKEDGPCTESLDPGVGIDTAGVAYLAYLRPSGVEYSVSKDHGATWSAPVRVSPPSQLSFSHVDVVAGAAGKLAIMWMGTSDSARGSSFADGWSAWHLYVAFVDDAAGAAPKVRVAMVTPPDDPVQRGCIWMYGGGDPCRNLLDFDDIALTPDGRVVIAYVDGCRAPCPTPADSRKADGMVAILDDGPRLFDGKAPWAAGVKFN